MPKIAFVRSIWAVTICLCLLGVAVVIRRAVVILAPPVHNTRPAASLDADFASHSWLTLAHITPGLLFMVLGPLQFSKGLRARRPALHRWTGRIFLVCGLAIGATALVMSPQMAIGGANEIAATMVFAMLFLFALAKGFVHIRARRPALHREWMIRAFAIGLAVATIRPIVGVFFATSRLTHLTPHDFFGTAFWLGFTMHLIAAEAWINYTRPRLPARA
jgi:hypothetical protein